MYMHDASIVTETPSGGVAAYPFVKEGEILASPARADALRLIEEKCQKGYRIAHEGVIPRVSREADRRWRGQINTVYDGGDEERLWGVQFTCK